MAVPYWVQDAVFYQIFPDRFANGSPENDPPNIQPWGSKPTQWGFKGGDLRGVIQKFDYLLDLGINAIYFNPIFQSTSNHRYHTSDYYRIDSLLGDMHDFRALLDTAHSNGVRVILDGVFNHSGRGFFAFSNILENQEFSPYKDWYHIHHFPVDAYSDGEAVDFKAWWGIKDLPKFNTDNPVVRSYLMDVARYWIEQGADGWRLDVPAEIDDDSFWAEFRNTVKSVNQDAYLVGEIWEADPRWVGDEHFDGLMNYPFREALLDLLDGKNNVLQYVERVEELLNKYPRENVFSMLLSLGSHDTQRLSTRLGGDVEKVKLALTSQFSLPGAPAIYYGDEIGLEGGKDPENRAAFPWDENQWNKELHSWVQHLITLRKRLIALRRGDYQLIAVNAELGYYAFSRILGEEKILVVVNASDKTRQLQIPVGELGWSEGRVLQDHLNDTRYAVSEGGISLTLPAWSGAWVGE